MDEKFTRKYFCRCIFTSFSGLYNYRREVSIALDFEPTIHGIYKLSIDSIISVNGKLIPTSWKKDPYSLHNIGHNEHDNYSEVLDTALRGLKAGYKYNRSKIIYEFYWYSQTCDDDISIELVYNWTHLVPKSEFENRIEALQLHIENMPGSISYEEAKLDFESRCKELV